MNNEEIQALVLQIQDDLTLEGKSLGERERRIVQLTKDFMVQMCDVFDVPVSSRPAMLRTVVLTGALSYYLEVSHANAAKDLEEFKRFLSTFNRFNKN